MPCPPTKHSGIHLTIIGKRNLSHAVPWIVAVTRMLPYPASQFPELIISSVGLKVTSLKWTGQDPAGSEALPRIPDKIEYNDTMERAKDISIVDTTDMVDQNGTHLKTIASNASQLTNRSRWLARSNRRCHGEAKATDDDPSETPPRNHYCE